MTTDLAPAIAEFRLPLSDPFSVDVIEADLRLGTIDREHGDNHEARWKAVGEYVTGLCGQPCAVSQAMQFYRAITKAAGDFFEADKKKATTSADSPTSTAATPEPSACGNAAPG